MVPSDDEHVPQLLHNGAAGAALIWGPWDASHSKCHQLPILVLDGAKPVIEVAQFTSEKIRRARQTDPKKAAGDDFAKFYNGDMMG